MENVSIICINKGKDDLVLLIVTFHLSKEFNNLKNDFRCVHRTDQLLQSGIIKIG